MKCEDIANNFTGPATMFMPVLPWDFENKIVNVSWLRKLLSQRQSLNLPPLHLKRRRIATVPCIGLYHDVEHAADSRHRHIQHSECSGSDFPDPTEPATVWKNPYIVFRKFEGFVVDSTGNRQPQQSI